MVMNNRMRNTRRVFLVSTMLALGLAACGKKGPLEPAPGSPDALKAEAQKKAEPEQASTTPPIGTGTRRRRPPPVTPPKGEPFLLDFLIQ